MVHFLFMNFVRKIYGNIDRKTYGCKVYVSKTIQQKFNRTTTVSASGLTTSFVGKEITKNRHNKDFKTVMRFINR